MLSCHFFPTIFAKKKIESKVFTSVWGASGDGNEQPVGLANNKESISKLSLAIVEVFSRQGSEEGSQHTAKNFLLLNVLEADSKDTAAYSNMHSAQMLWETLLHDLKYWRRDQEKQKHGINKMKAYSGIKLSNKKEKSISLLQKHLAVNARLLRGNGFYDSQHY